jgi:hypothetical protein
MKPLDDNRIEQDACAAIGSMFAPTVGARIV